MYADYETVNTITSIQVFVPLTRSACTHSRFAIVFTTAADCFTYTGTAVGVDITTVNTIRSVTAAVQLIEVAAAGIGTVAIIITSTADRLTGAC